MVHHSRDWDHLPIYFTNHSASAIQLYRSELMSVSFNFVDSIRDNNCQPTMGAEFYIFTDILQQQHSGSKFFDRRMQWNLYWPGKIVTMREKCKRYIQLQHLYLKGVHLLSRGSGVVLESCVHQSVCQLTKTNYSKSNQMTFYFISMVA